MSVGEFGSDSAAKVSNASPPLKRICCTGDEFACRRIVSGEVIGLSRNRISLPLLAALSAMAALIFDSQTAIQAAADAVQICLRTAIASLFPFFVISIYLVPHISQLQIPILERFLHLPDGWGSVFLLSCMGGYPVGAQCIALGFESGKLDKNQAMRMLGFCNNCGPSFLFGIVGTFFTNPWTSAALLAICICSAAAVGTFWPGNDSPSHAAASTETVPLMLAVQKAIRSMATVCAWIILGKVVLAFLTKWVLWIFPIELRLLVSGLLELTNGCLILNQYASEEVRFIAACAITCFGGLCVAMQVKSICARVNLDSSFYLPQKLCQTLVAAGLAVIYVSLHCHEAVRILILILLVVGCGIFRKMAVEIPKQMMYNSRSKGGL